MRFSLKQLIAEKTQRDTRTKNVCSYGMTFVDSLEESLVIYQPRNLLQNFLVLEYKATGEINKVCLLNKIKFSPFCPHCFQVSFFTNLQTTQQLIDFKKPVPANKMVFFSKKYRMFKIII